MLASNFTIISVTCNEDEIDKIINLTIKSINKKFKCIEVNKKDFKKYTSITKPHYIGKINKEYSYINNKKSLKENSSNVDLDLKKAITSYKSDFTKMSDLDIDINPFYFTLETNYIYPFDKELNKYINPKLYMRITLNKLLPIREESLMYHLTEMISKNRETEYFHIQRNSTRAEDKNGKEMYFQYKNKILKQTMSAKAGLFTHIRNITGVDIQLIMEQIDRNIDISLAPSIIKQAKKSIKDSELLIEKFDKKNEQSQEMINDIILSNKEVNSLIEKNKKLLQNVTEKDGMMYIKYLKIVL